MLHQNPIIRLLFPCSVCSHTASERTIDPRFPFALRPPTSSMASDKPILAALTGSEFGFCCGKHCNLHRHKSDQCSGPKCESRFCLSISAFKRRDQQDLSSPEKSVHHCSGIGAL